jgi:ABC-type transport system involved in multi-copper enzyme maturation permease subunit
MIPIVRREILEFLRGRAAASALVALAVASVALVLLRWPTGDSVELSGARGAQVLRVFGYALLAAVVFVLPAFPATAVVREKVNGTLALLLNTPLSITSIYFGKLGGALACAALIFVVTAPAAAACHALGGPPSSGGVGALYAVLAVAALQLATLALLISSRSNSAETALRATYAFVLAVVLLPLIPFWLLEGQQGMGADVAGALRALSPVPAVLEVLGQGGSGRGLSAGTGAIVPYLVAALLSSAAFALATIVRLARNPLDRARPAGVMTQDRSGRGRFLRRLLFLIDPQRRSGSTSLLFNAVLVKELRTRRFGRSHWSLRLIALCAILSLALSYLAASGALSWGAGAIGGGLVLLQSALLILFVPSLASGLISAEREGKTWQLLRATPLSAGKILRGKLLSVVWPLVLLLCGTIPGYVVMAAIEPEQFARAQRTVACLGALAVFAVVASAAVGSLFRATAAATAAAYLVVVGTCLGPLLVWLGRDAPFGFAAVENALTVSPLAAALVAADTPGFAGYDVLPMNWWITGGASAALLVLLAVRVRQLYRPE